ncbi:hypothetical protein N181_22775 [Sinorhizobium fredii USDA 205]|nr:hypothetical protein AOX55_00002538 [Sinorhizobium fredii CCBAU 25509]KSV85677.1 hypothetical protein N181_22775 [Sinorhizobium fredii USDA 205]
MSPFLLEMVIPRIFDPVKRFRWKTAQIGKKGRPAGICAVYQLSLKM